MSDSNPVFRLSLIRSHEPSKSANTGNNKRKAPAIPETAVPIPAKDAAAPADAPEAEVTASNHVVIPVAASVAAPPAIPAAPATAEAPAAAPPAAPENNPNNPIRLCILVAILPNATSPESALPNPETATLTAINPAAKATSVSGGILSNTLATHSRAFANASINSGKPSSIVHFASGNNVPSNASASLSEITPTKSLNASASFLTLSKSGLKSISFAHCLNASDISFAFSSK